MSVMHTIRFDAVDSTNAAGRRLLDAGELADRTLIIAREQTAGRGTKGRSWSSPRDAGVYMTFARVLRDESWPVAPAYTLAAGLACADVLREATGIEVRVKPINDLIVAGRKLGGILTESVVEAGRLRALLTGVGVNVRRAPLDLPPDAAPPTCLEEHLPPERLAALWTPRSDSNQNRDRKGTAGSPDNHNIVNENALARDLAAAIDDWHASVATGRLDRLTAAWPRLGLCGTPMPDMTRGS